jgi:hypothetical protein
MTTNARREKADREINDQSGEYRRKIYVQTGKVQCKDCLAEIGVVPGTTDPTTTFDYTSNDVSRVV